MAISCLSLSINGIDRSYRYSIPQLRNRFGTYWKSEMNSFSTRNFWALSWLLFASVHCSPLHAQREPLMNGWENFGLLKATFFDRMIIGRYVSVRSWPNQLHLPKNFSQRFKAAFEEQLKAVYASEPVYMDALKILKEIRTKEGIHDPPGDCSRRGMSISPRPGRSQNGGGG